MIPAETHDQEQGRSVPVETGESSLDVLIILARQKRFISRFTCGAVLLTILIVLLIPNKYTAATTVLPPAQSSSSLSSALLGQIGVSGASALASLASAGLGVKSPGDMYVSFFRSRTVEDAVIQRFGLKARYHKKTMYDARRAFEKCSTVVLGTKDGLIRITVEDRDPKLAAEIANGYVDEFKKLSATLAVTEASQRRVFFEQQLRDARGNLTNAEEAMKQTEHSTGVLQIDSQAKALIETAAMLRGQEVAREVQLQAMRSYATEDNPELVAIKEQLVAIKAQLAKIGGGQDSTTDLIVPKGKIPEASMEYLRSLRNLKYYEALYEVIAKQYELAKLDEARQGAITQVADVAVPPDKKSSPHRLIITILVFLLALFGSCIMCIFAERIRIMEQNPAQRYRLDALRKALHWRGLI